MIIYWVKVQTIYERTTLSKQHQHIRELGCRKVQNLSKCGSGLGGTNWLSSSLQLACTCTWDAGSPGQAQVPALGLGMGGGIAGPVANL